jgi:hypothetical protein
VNAGRKGVYGEHRHYEMYLGALTNAGRPAPNNPQLRLPTF